MSKYDDYLKIIFNELGFSDESASVYYETLKMGKASVQEIARKAQVPRSSCYDILDRLKRSGLISSVKEEGKTFIIAEDPNLIRSKLEKLRENKSKALSNFLEISNHLDILGGRRSGKQPDVRLYEGFDSMKKVLFDMLKEGKDKEMLNICQGEADKFVGLSRDPQYLKDYIKESEKYRVKERAILEDMKSAREYKKKNESDNYEILLSPQLSNPNTAHIDKYIFGDYVIILNFEKDYAVVIHDLYIAENERISFNVLWNALKEGAYKY